jgi:calcium-dependent protein kinase
MLTKPEKRLTAGQILEHAWFKLDKNKKTVAHNLNLGHLREFTNTSKLKKAVLTCMASQLSEHEIMDLRNIFLELDKNGDGTLTMEELAEGICLLFRLNLNRTFKTPRI